MHRLTLRLAVALLAVTGLPVAHAQSVALAGILGGKALLVLEVAGAQRAIQLGESPVSIGGSAAGQRIVLKADARGHFINSGFINGRVMQYMVDTGATTVAIGRPDAQRMGLKFEQGQPVMMNTANGTAQGWRMRLESVRVGDVELRSVDAIVTAEAMPYVLLGNSFLREFHMNRSGDEMVLQRRR